MSQDSTRQGLKARITQLLTGSSNTPDPDPASVRVTSVTTYAEGGRVTTREVNGDDIAGLHGVKDVLEAGVAEQEARRFMDLGRFEEAEMAMLRCLAIERRIGDQGRIAATLGNLGAIYLEAGQLKKAEAAVKEGLTIDESLDRSIGIAKHKLALAHIYARTKDYAKAKTLAQESQNLARELDDEAGYWATKDLLDWLARRK